MNLATQVALDRGQPSIVRIGVVTAVNPVQVSMQGTVLSSPGVLDGYGPTVGDNVAVLGQSAISANGSSWLVLGRVNQADLSAPGFGRLVAWYKRETDTIPTGAGAATIGILRLTTFTQVPGHLYWLVGQAHCDSDTNGTTMDLTIRLTTDGTPAGAASTGLVASTYEQSDAAQPEAVLCIFPYLPTVSAPLSLCLAVGGPNNTRCTASVVRPAALYVFDQGPAVAASGVNI